MAHEDPGDRPTPIGLAPGIPSEAAGQDEAKYSTSNPVVRRLIDRFLGRARALVGDGDGTVLDVGTGEGFALEHVVTSARRVVAAELRADKLRVARSRLANVAPVVCDAGMLPVARVPVSLCLEVLEHLTEPDRAVAELARVTEDRCVVSVPWEPWFRLGNLARGKNVARWGNDPEHVQAFGPSRIRRLLQGHFESVEVHRAFPWLVVVASRPRVG